MKIPILGNVNLSLKELLILGGSALVAYYFINKHATEFRAYEKEILAGDKKIPAIAPIAPAPTSPVPPIREMQRISGFNARESSGGCGCGG